MVDRVDPLRDLIHGMIAGRIDAMLFVRFSFGSFTRSPPRWAQPKR
jgi:hypothetical protein